MSIHYYWWPLCVILLYGIHAYASFHNKGNTDWKSFLTVWGIGIFITPLWPIISRVSKNLMFDGMLFDILIFVTYATIFMMLEKHYISFKPLNYIGIGLVILGMFLIKK